MQDARWGRRDWDGGWRMVKDVGCGMQAGLGMQDAGGRIGFTVMDVLSRIQPKPVDADPGIQGSCHPSTATTSAQTIHPQRRMQTRIQPAAFDSALPSDTAGSYVFNPGG